MRDRRTATGASSYAQPPLSKAAEAFGQSQADLPLDAIVELSVAEMHGESDKSNARRRRNDFAFEYSVVFGRLRIHAWNGEVVRVDFAMGTCDREVMSWSASTAVVTGEMIRDMMLVAVESRFSAYRATNRLEWLTDNGSCYTAAETIDFAHQLGLTPCFTPDSQP